MHGETSGTKFSFAASTNSRNYVCDWITLLDVLSCIGGVHRHDAVALRQQGLKDTCTGSRTLSRHLDGHLRRSVGLSQVDAKAFHPFPLDYFPHKQIFVIILFLEEGMDMTILY